MLWTRFASPQADQSWQEDMTWQETLDHISKAGPFPDKAHCAWLKLATFGATRTAHGSLRHDANVVSIAGVEGDYDAEQVSPEEAIARLERYQIRAAVYTSPSHQHDRPRWRVLAPLSKNHSPHSRNQYLARINGALGGILATESFTLSQSYYYGRVNGNIHNYKVLTTFGDPEDGYCIDELDDLDNIAIGRKRTRELDDINLDAPVEIEKPTTTQWQAIRALPKFQATWDMRRPEFTDQSPSAYDLALANLAVIAEWPDPCIVYLLWKWRTTQQLDTAKLQRASYVTRTLAKAKAKETTWEDPLKKPKQKNPLPIENPLNWIEDFTLSDEEAEKLADPEWAYENLIIRGHVIVICGESGVGKTTIMMEVSAQLVSSGYQVNYVNADTSGGDAKQLKAFADANGFALLLPDLKVGLSMNDVISKLEQMAELNIELNDVVFVFDTLKKMTDVISKTKSKELYKLFRRLSGMGATLICNAHTNKYKGEDGLPIYEGTGDLRSDVDELIYLVATKRPDNSILVSTLPDKTRGSFEPITFCIGPDRSVSRHDYVDVASNNRRSRQLDDDADVITRILDFLQGGQRSQTEIVEHCHAHKISRNTSRRVLRQYGSRNSDPQLWLTEKGFQKNAWLYRLDRPDVPRKPGE